MKTDIHPTFHEKVAMTCACGKVYETGSTKESIFIELCSTCHPFYTGKQKIVDSARRVEKFEARSKAKVETVHGSKAKLKKKAARAQKREAKQKAEA